MNDKKYVGKGVVHAFQNGGKILKLGIKYSELTPNDKGYVNLVVAQMKEPDKYGKTHTIYVDDFKPGAKGGAPAPKDDEMPF
jgi:hypothetical protein